MEKMFQFPKFEMALSGKCAGFGVNVTSKRKLIIQPHVWFFYSNICENRQGTHPQSVKT